MKSALLGLAVGALAAAFIMTYRFGLSTQADRDAVVIHRLTIERDAAWVTIETLHEAAEHDAQQAALQQASTEMVIASLAAKRQQAADEAAAWHEQFHRAAQSPNCAAVLEQTICPAVFKD